MLYFEPKEDISAYQISDKEQEKQNQIDKDVYKMLMNSIDTVENNKEKYTFIYVEQDPDVTGTLAFLESLTPERLKEDELNEKRMMLGQLEMDIENKKRMMNPNEYKTEDEHQADYKDSMMNFKEFIKNKGKDDNYENFIEYKQYESNSIINSIKEGNSTMAIGFKLYDKDNIDEYKKDNRVAQRAQK